MFLVLALNKKIPAGRELWIWSHLLKKPLMESFTFCAVTS